MLEDRLGKRCGLVSRRLRLWGPLLLWKVISRGIISARTDDLKGHLEEWQELNALSLISNITDSVIP